MRFVLAKDRRMRYKSSDPRKEPLMPMTHRERMLAAIDGKKPDYVPLSFMIFNALRARSEGWKHFVENALALGLDPVVDLLFCSPTNGPEHSDAGGPPVQFPSDVVTREWRERPTDSPYPVLHKEYVTPKGTLSIAVNRTDDWYLGDHVPFLNDYLEPRATKRLVASRADLPALAYLLSGPDDADLAPYRAAWKEAAAFARSRDLLLSTGWGIGTDSLAWVFGLTDAVMTAVDDPEFLGELLGLIEAWNRRRMIAMLEVKPDLFVRRGWYEGTSFWSPALFRRFILPSLKREVKLAHEAGAKFGYIFTVGANQFADLLVDAGVDVVIGVDDVQDHGMDFRELKKKSRGKFALWGGVNGFVTIEDGDEKMIRKATADALSSLGPDGFILSPVDNIRLHTDDVWRKTTFFIDAWKREVGRA
jgi:hypothetical protein